MKKDLYGNPVLPQVKCRHCGKFKGEHLAQFYNCPIGPKHRVMGHTSYHQKNTYKAKEKP